MHVIPEQTPVGHCYVYFWFSSLSRGIYWYVYMRLQHVLPNVCDDDTSHHLRQHI